MDEVERPGPPAPAAGARQRLPAGSWDCHFHVFDGARFPYAQPRSYTPPDATVQAYRRLAARLGIERAVLVHPSVFGEDHQALETVLASEGRWMRGVAVVFPHTPDDRIERWHALGVRGTRMNALFAGGVAAADLRRIAERVRPFGWHLQLLIDVVRDVALLQQAASLGLPLVVDHYGHPSAPRDPDAPGFRALLDLVGDGRAWVKLSAPYRLSPHGPDYPDVRPLAEALLRANPDRLIWGTDWPHPAVDPLPDDDRLTDLLFDWLAPAERERVLIHNPSQLYGLA